MDPSFKSRVIECTPQTKGTTLGCDWRLHKDFGGVFDTLPTMSLNLETPFKPTRLAVSWKTNELPSLNSNPLPTSVKDFLQWVASGPSEVGVRMGKGVNSEETRVTPHVASVLNSLSSDDPISLWHQRNKHHEKAKRFVLFRKDPLPFNLQQSGMKEPVMACESESENDEI